MVSALLGLLVSLSTFLCIGATSSVTYNGANLQPIAHGPMLNKIRSSPSATQLRRSLLL